MKFLNFRNRLESLSAHNNCYNATNKLNTHVLHCDSGYSTDGDDPGTVIQVWNDG
jgi:hypothetical protein